MRTLKSLVIVLLLVVVSACAGKKVNTNPQQVAKEKARIEALKAQIAGSDLENKVRERAAEIKVAEDLKKAKKELAKSDTPEMRKARKQLADEKKQMGDIVRLQQKADSLAGVTGCADGSVKVDPRALEFTTFVDSVTFRVTNTTNDMRNIETSFRGLGVIVRDLCPGGSVSLSFSRRIWNSPQYENIVLVATGQGKGGVVTENFSATLYASYGNNGVRRENRVWTLTRK